MAATWLRQVLTYSTPSTMIGVPSFSQMLSLRACTIASSGDLHRQAIRRLLTFAGPIWLSGEYLLLALSPPYTGHSPAFEADLGAAGLPSARPGTGAPALGPPGSVA